MSCKLLSYQAGREARAGVLVGDTVYDATKVTAVPAYERARHARGLVFTDNQSSRIEREEAKLYYSLGVVAVSIPDGPGNDQCRLIWPVAPASTCPS